MEDLIHWHESNISSYVSEAANINKLVYWIATPVCGVAWWTPSFGTWAKSIFTDTSSDICTNVQYTIISAEKI